MSAEWNTIIPCTVCGSDHYFLFLRSDPRHDNLRMHDIFLRRKNAKPKSKSLPGYYHVGGFGTKNFKINKLFNIVVVVLAVFNAITYFIFFQLWHHFVSFRKIFETAWNEKWAHLIGHAYHAQPKKWDLVRWCHRGLGLFTFKEI